jgi:hypothetical protein
MDDAFRKQWDDDHPLGWVEHRMAFGPRGEYGKWLAKHNTAVRINDILFLHGGISPKYAAAARGSLNDTVRRELAGPAQLLDVAIDPLGPLWYRGLAADPEAALSAHVDAVLQFHGVRRIAIGHTPTPGLILPRFGGKVILIDVGLSQYYGSNPACLIVANGKPQAWHRGKVLDLPVDGADPSAYFKTLGVTDPRVLRKE